MTADIQAAKERFSGLVAIVAKYFRMEGATESAETMLADRDVLLAELSRLEGENERLRDEVANRDEAIAGHQSLCTEYMLRCEDAETALAEARRQIADLDYQLNSERFEVSELRRQIAERDEALKPLAEVAHVKLCGVWRDDEHIWHTDAASHITFGQARRAAALLESSEPAGGKEEDEGPCAICSDPDDDGPCPEHRPAPATAALAKALKPFADIYRDHMTKGKYGPVWGFNDGTVTHEQFRHAALVYDAHVAALEGGWAQ